MLSARLCRRCVRRRKMALSAEHKAVRKRRQLRFSASKRLLRADTAFLGCRFRRRKVPKRGKHHTDREHRSALLPPLRSVRSCRALRSARSALDRRQHGECRRSQRDPFIYRDRGFFARARLSEDSLAPSSEQGEGSGGGIPRI